MTKDELVKIIFFDCRSVWKIWNFILFSEMVKKIMGIIRL